MVNSLRLVHLSDLHFSKPCLSPSQFFSKRWIGNLSSMLSITRDFRPELLDPLIDFFVQKKIDIALISGDLSTTSQKSEFSIALSFIEKIKAAGIEVFVIPGNHDHYTKQDYHHQTFYRFFPSHYGETSSLSEYNLEDHNVAAKKISPNWWLVLLDTAIATSAVSSQGFFSPKTEKHLTRVLEQIPEQEQILIINHFPLIQIESKRRHLKNAEALQELLKKHPNVKLYLHGHSHHNRWLDRRSEGYPLILDSGSTSHSQRGTWNLLELTETGCEIQAFKPNALLSEQKNEWIPFREEKISY